MKKIKTTYKMTASKEDVIEAIKLLMMQYSNQIEGKITVEPKFKTEQIVLGVYDSDYIKVFDGLEITVIEE